MSGSLNFVILNRSVNYDLSVFFLKRKMFILNIKKKSDFFPKAKQFDVKILLQDEILFTLCSMDRRMKTNNIFLLKLKNTFKQILSAIS